jgi:hypothetical protein
MGQKNQPQPGKQDPRHGEREDDPRRRAEPGTERNPQHQPDRNDPEYPNNPRRQPSRQDEERDR